ncbi:hypothetical protein BH11MYX4_BH11MYX4_01930 [soil metagenome]
MTLRPAIAHTWPDHYPHSCPPADAAPVSGDVYRLVENDPPTTADMQSYFVLNLASGQDCKRCSLSCYRNVDDANQLRDSVPKFRGHKIAQAALGPGHGRIDATGKNGHRSLWVAKAHVPTIHVLFKVVA